MRLLQREYKPISPKICKNPGVESFKLIIGFTASSVISANSKLTFRTGVEFNITREKQKTEV